MKYFSVDTAPDFLYDMKKLIAMREPALEIVKKIATKGPQVTDVVWKLPVPNPKKIFAVSINYRAHGEESGVELLPKPYFFPKFPNALVWTRG